MGVLHPPLKIESYCHGRMQYARDNRIQSVEEFNFFA